VYDVFRLFSNGIQFKVDRNSFCKGLHRCVTLKQLSVVKRARLQERFRESAQDMTLEEFLRMYWPKTAKDDMKSLIQWCHLREAQIVFDGNEASEESVLRRTYFDLLDVKGDEGLSVEKLLQAGVLTSEQVNLIGSRHDRQDAKALAAVALFGKVIDESTCEQVLSSGCVKWDGKLSFEDLFAMVRSRTNLDNSNTTCSP
jgi:hypothetical protein